MKLINKILTINIKYGVGVMEVINKDNSVAVIIALEDYRCSKEKGGFSSVAFARNDARSFRELLINDFGLDESQIHMWIDGDATKTAIENDLPYIIT